MIPLYNAIYTTIAVNQDLYYTVNIHFIITAALFDFLKKFLHFILTHKLLICSYKAIPRALILTLIFEIVKILFYK